MQNIVERARRAVSDLHAAGPFVPSLAQVEAALQPIVDELLAAPLHEARAAMQGAQPGRAESTAIAMFKAQRAEREAAASRHVVDGLNVEFLGARRPRAGEDY